MKAKKSTGKARKPASLPKSDGNAGVRAYVASGEGDDKAGAYAVQGLAGAFVERIDGSVTNVVGLPLVETLEMLSRAGVELPWM